MENNKYFKELKQAFGFECYIGDVYNLRGKDVDYVCYISESAEGNTLYILKEAGKDIQIMTDVFTNQYSLIDAIRNILMDGDNILVDDHLAMWLDMETGEFWEGFYNMALNAKYITNELV
jgi:hypothetical protein